MKKIINTIIVILFAQLIQAQDAKTEINLKDLAVPNSPAFTITDFTPSVIQSPNTPKSFVFGVLHAFQNSSNKFPENYSAEFAPFWLIKPKSMSVYAYNGNNKDSTKENPFAGLKFTSMSLAFLNNDLIPDSNNMNHKIVSIGSRSTIIKIHSKGYSKNLNNKMNEWHTQALEELNVANLEKNLRSNTENKAETILTSLKKLKSDSLANTVKDLLNIKPIFSWDIASAYAIYGIGDSNWQTGRIGIWSTITSNIPIQFDKNKSSTNYLNLNLCVRYLHDAYGKNNSGSISTINYLDLGGKMVFQFEKLNFGVESLYRFNNKLIGNQNRTVGLLEYKIADNIYITGAFGENFNSPNKLISVLGLNWGLGSESVKLPSLKD